MVKTVNIMELGPIQKKWIETLKKYPERQLKGQLGIMKENGEIKLCCLGQLGLISKHMKWSKDKEFKYLKCTDPNDANKFSNGFFRFTFNEVGLLDSAGIFKKAVYINENKYISLSNMNDGGVSWLEIAKYVESNPDNVFTKSY